MLYLKFPADVLSPEPPRRVPLTGQIALQIERALLSDDVGRLEIVRKMLADDHNFSGWAMRTAEMRTARTVNQIEDAANWLGESLIVELARSLEHDVTSESASDNEWRLPAIVARLSECDQKLREFDRRLEHEKLESLKELAYGASHEINNPLANIAARAQTLLEDEEDSARARKLTAIHRQAMRAHEMISDLMLFARPPKLFPSSFDLSKLAARVTDELSDLALESGVELICESTHAPIEITADETQIGVAIQAVVKNAIEAAAHSGHVRVTTRRDESPDCPAAEISVSDDGPGISDDVRRHMFDPFYSGREAGRGLGFGLSKCWRIVTDHGGDVIVHRQHRGAEISIRLPLSSY
jgi:signal transduction histidine kinase